MQNVQTAHLGETSQATMIMTPAAAKNLADNLYRNKIKAVLREYSNNALDGHTAVGTPERPFNVTLPSSLNPELSIRDFGPGLSHDFMMQNFTCYFYSTKEQQVKQTGELGLGSKAGHAYCDHFTAISRQGGEKRIYTLYKDDDWMPAITLQTTLPTDEPDGFEIKIPVRASDITEFDATARSLYTYFNPRPRITNVPNFTFVEPTYTTEGQGWKLRQVPRYHYDRPQAIMNNVCYPVQYRDIPSLTDDEEMLLQCPLDLWFEPGELSFAMSREDLSYDRKTCEALKRRIAQVTLELPRKFASEVQAAETLWDAKVLYHDRVRRNESIPHKLQEVLKESLTYRGHKLSAATHLRSYQGEVALVADREFRLSRIQCDYRSHLHFTPTSNTVVIWDDLSDRRVPSTLMHNFWGGAVSVVVLRTNDPAVLQDMLNQLGNPPYERLADLEKPPVASTKRANRTKPEMQKLYHYTLLNGLVETDHDVNSGGLYIDLHRWNPVDKNGAEVKKLDRHLKLARELDLLNEPVFAIPASHKTVRNKAGWENVLDVLADRLKAYIAEHDMERRIANLRHLRDHDRHHLADRVARHLIGHDLWPRKKVGSPLRKLMVAYDHLRSDDDPDVVTTSNLAGRLGVELRDLKPTHNLKPLLEAAETQYPLLERMPSSDFVNRERAEQWLVYINACD